MACRIWQIAQQTHTQMMGYIIQTDSALLVVDGGMRGDAAYLKHLLRRIGGEKPHIDAWFLTHPHSDHIGAFVQLMETEPDAFAIDNICLHFPARSLLEEGEPAALRIYDAYQAIRPRIAHLERTLQEGMHLTFGNMQWDVLYVSDPSFVHNASNNSSCVLRLTVEDTTLLFLGDLGVEGGEKLLRMHGNALKSDIVQMAHHGQSAVRMDVYDVIRPFVCLWCAPDWLWYNNQGNRGYDSGVWDILRVRRHMRALGVRRHVVAKDGTMLLTLQNGRTDIACYDPFAAQ